MCFSLKEVDVSEDDIQGIHMQVIHIHIDMFTHIQDHTYSFNKEIESLTHYFGVVTLWQPWNFTFSHFYVLFPELNHSYRFLPCLHPQQDGEDPVNCKKLG